MPKSVLTDAFSITRYRADLHRAACVDVFDSNVPDYFLPSERAQFEAFLDDLPGPYFVGESGGRVVACGGIALSDEGGRADLCWGMVHRSVHRRGLGRRLTRYRVEEARGLPGVRQIALQTSQHTKDFYRSLGFEIVEVEADGFGEGMDRLDLRLNLEKAWSGDTHRGASEAGEGGSEASGGASEAGGGGSDSLGRGGDAAGVTGDAPWLPDRTLDAEGALAAISAVFTDLSVEAVDFVGAGWEFDVYRVTDPTTGDEWAFRFPRRQEYAQHFDREAVILERVTDTVAPVQTPRIERRGGPGPHFPYAFAGHRFIPGRPADDAGVILSPAFASTLGAALTRLHTLEPDDAFRQAVGREGEGPSDWFEETLAESEGLRGLGGIVDEALSWLDAGPVAPPPHPGPDCFIHNDLSPDHLLVNEIGDLIGIIDWTDATMGDPALDFIVLYAWRGPAFVDDVLAAYDVAPDAHFRERLDFSVRVRTLHWLHAAVQERGNVSKHRRWVANAFGGVG